MATLAALAPLVAASLLGSAPGSGTASNAVREVPEFHAVRVAAGIRVALEIGPRKPLELSGDADVLPLVVTEVVDGELRIHFVQTERISARRGDTIDVGQFKEFFGLSRKVAIPLLEYFDREGVTKRVGDARQVL